jgi:hypothetical protein
MVIIDVNKPAFSFDYKENSKWNHCACRVAKVMALTFHKGMYKDGDRLLDVLHHDRNPTPL